ncbi:MAG: response regulator transcription factor [Bacillota bacterium]|nr:response regulator transcription factor [Bacillota bacterium]
MATVFVVDDDHNICDLVRMYLEKEGYAVSFAHDGEEALSVFRDITPDIVLLDLMLPKIDGMEVCREIRKTSEVPIIMLTAKGETFDKVLGLEMGADDYVVKPFEPRELLARVKAVLRRTEARVLEAKEIIYPKLSINLTTYKLKIAGESVEIPRKELELLYFLASNHDKVYTRDQLLDNVWGYEFFGNTRTVDVHIHRLREKLDGVDASWGLKTVSGVGYKFETK